MPVHLIIFPGTLSLSQTQWKQASVARESLCMAWRMSSNVSYLLIWSNIFSRKSWFGLGFSVSSSFHPGWVQPYCSFSTISSYMFSYLIFDFIGGTYVSHWIKHLCWTKHLFHGHWLILTSSQLLVALGILVLVCQFKKGLYQPSTDECYWTVQHSSTVAQ